MTDKRDEALVLLLVLLCFGSFYLPDNVDFTTGMLVYTGVFGGQPPSSSSLGPVSPLSNSDNIYSTKAVSCNGQSCSSSSIILADWDLDIPDNANIIKAQVLIEYRLIPSLGTPELHVEYFDGTYHTLGVLPTSTSDTTHVFDFNYTPQSKHKFRLPLAISTDQDAAGATLYIDMLRLKVEYDGVTYEIPSAALQAPSREVVDFFVQSVNRTWFHQGETVQVLGSGFSPGEAVTLSGLDNAQLTADNDGKVSHTYTIPNDKEPGEVFAHFTTSNHTTSYRLSINAKTPVEVKKPKQDENFSAIIDNVTRGTDLVVRFHHEASEAQPIRVVGKVNYTLSTNYSQPNEEVTLTVHNWNNRRFRIAVGHGTDVLEFGEPITVSLDPTIKNADGNTIQSTVEITDSVVGDAVYNATAASTSLDEGTYDMKITLQYTPVEQIILEDVEAYENVQDLVKVHDTPEDGQFVETYSIDPEAINFTKGTVTVTAKGRKLYKCKDWDFQSQTCQGEWVLFKTGLIPGQQYTFEISPDDPGFGEGGRGGNVLRGEVTGSTNPLTQTIPAISPENAFILFTTLSTDNAPDETFYVPNITSSTSISFEKSAATVSNTLRWQIIESDDIVVQRGQRSLATSVDTVTVTIDPVQLNKTFVVVYGTCDGTGNGDSHSAFFAANLTSTTSLTLIRGNAGKCNSEVSYQVVTWNSTFVQKGEVIKGTGALSVTDTITSVDESESFLIFGSASIGTDDGMDSNYIQGNITSSTSLFFQQEPAGANTNNERLIDWYVVSLPGASVQKGATALAGDTTETISSVNSSQAFHWDSGWGTGGGTSYSNSKYTINMSSDTSLFIDKATGSQTQNLVWWVIELPDEDVIPPEVFDVRPVAGGNGTGTIEIAANFSDVYIEDSIFANVTLPDGSITILPLINVASDKYNASFTLTLSGLYNITFFANDSFNNLNNTIQTNITVLNGPPSTPTNITCDGSNNCNITASTTTELMCVGSIDPDGDPITYFLQALLENNTQTADLESGDIGQSATGAATTISFVNASGSAGTSHVMDIGSIGDDRLLVVYLDDESTIGDSFGGAVTIGGVTATQLEVADNLIGIGNHLEAHYFTEDNLSSLSGSQTISFSGGDTGWAMHAQLFTNVSAVGPFDVQKDNTSEAQTEVAPAPVDIPENGLITMAAANGQSGGYNDGDWDTNPTIATDDGLSPEFELFEVTDGPQPSSAIFATAWNVSTTTAQTNRQFRAEGSTANNRGAGIIATFSPVISTSAEENSSFSNYNDVGAAESSTIISSIGIKVGVVAYNPVASVANGNNKPDLEVQFYNGTEFQNVGILNLPSTYTGSVQNNTHFNLTLHTNNATLLSAWSTPANQDVRIRSIQLDFDGSDRDQVNFTSVIVHVNGSSWLDIGNHSDGSSLTWNVTPLPAQTNVDLRCRAIDVFGTNTFSSFFTKGSNLTIVDFVDITPPEVFDVRPQGEEFLINQTVVISANVTDDGVISSVIANVSFPDATFLELPLVNTVDDLYTANFTNLTLSGVYNVSFIATDGTAKVNDSIFTNFTRAKVNIIDVVDNSSTPVEYDVIVDSQVGNIQSLNITILNQPPIQSVRVFGYDTTSPNTIIQLKNDSGDDIDFIFRYWVDFSLFNLTEANVTVTATGNNLLKCTDFNITSLECLDDADYFPLFSGLTPGQNYTFTLNATDPGFGETITGPDNISDSRLRSSTPDDNFGTSDYLRVGLNNAGSAIFRSPIWFNLSNIPENATIVSASLELFFYRIPGSGVTGDRTHAVHRVVQDPLRPWIEDEVTWNNFTAGEAWTNAGGDFNATQTDNATFDSTALSSFIAYDVTLDVADFYANQSRNFGWMIKDTEESTSNTRRDYRSKNHGTASEQPRLIINFTLPDNNPPEVSNVIPNGTLFNNNDTVFVAAQVVDNFFVDKVVANITIPFDVVEPVTMLFNNITQQYEGSFSNTSSVGQYNITIIANDTDGNFNTSIFRRFFVVRPNVTINKSDNPDPVEVGDILTYQINLTTLKTEGSSVPLEFEGFKFLTNDTFDDNSPQLIATTEGTLIIAYHRTDAGGNENIYVLRSENNGFNFSDPIQVTDEAEDDVFPNLIQDQDGNILIVYVHDVGPQNDIFLVNSSDDGVTWNEPFDLTSTSGTSEFEPSIEQDSSGMYYLSYTAPNVNDTFEMDNITDVEIFIRNETDFTQVFGEQVRLTVNNYSDFDIDMMIVNDTFYFAWAPEFPDFQDIWIVNTTNPLTPLELTNNMIQVTDNDFFDFETSLTTDADGLIYVGYVALLNVSQVGESDEGRTSNEIFFSVSDDQGQTFQTVQVTNNSVSDGYPSLVQSGVTGLFFIAGIRPDPPFPDASSEMEITFAQRVASPEDAINVTVIDVIPPGLIVQNISDGGVVVGDTVVWDIPQFFSGTTESLTFTALVNSTVPNQTIIFNHANITYFNKLSQFIAFDNVTINTTILDTRVPSVILLEPIAGSFFNATDNVSIIANVTDAGLIDTVFANVSIPGDGTEPVPMVLNPATGLFEGNFTNTTAIGIYNVTLIANDSAGNVNNTQTTFFIVANSVTSVPTDILCDGNTNCNITRNETVELMCVGSVDPDGDTVTYFVEAFFNASRQQDIGLFNTTFEVSNDTFFYIDDAFGSTSAPTQADGANVLNGNCTSGRCLNVNLNVNSPVAGGPFSGAFRKPFNVTAPSVKLNITANYTLRISDETEAEDNIQLRITNLSNGVELIIDTRPGQAGTTGTDQFKTGAFSSLQTIPVGQYNLDIGCFLNTTEATDEDGECWIDTIEAIIINGTVTNYSWELIGNHSEGGAFNWTLTDKMLQTDVGFRCRATDNGSLMFSDFYDDNANFTIEDITPPAVLELEAFPANGTIFNITQTIDIGVNVTDNTATDVVFANITLPNGSTFILNLVDTFPFDQYNNTFDIPLLLGQYNVTFFANDSSGNLNATTTTNFIAVDPFPPEVFDEQPPLSSTESAGSTIQIGANVTDEIAVDVVIANVTAPDGSTTQFILINDVDDKFNNSFAIPAQIGVFNVTFFANDSSGNINASEFTNFTAIDDVPPEVIDPIPFSDGISNTTVAINTTLTISANVTDNIAVDVVLANITFPNSSVITIPLILGDDSIYNNTFDLPDLIGRYNVSYFANDTSNNINNSVTSFFLIVPDILPPEVFDPKPPGDQSFNLSETITIQVNVTDDTMVDFVFANITLPNGSIIQLTLPLGDGDTYNSTFALPDLANGTYDVLFFANDSNNNINFTTNTSFFVGNILALLDTNSTESTGAPVNLTLTIVDSQGNEVFLDTDLTFDLAIPPGMYNFTLEPVNKSRIFNITIHEVNITGRFNLTGIDYTDVAKRYAQNVNPFAFEPFGLDFDVAVIEKLAENVTLYKCANWNYSSGECGDLSCGNDQEEAGLCEVNATWIRIEENLVEGSIYSFNVTPTDPGFSEYTEQDTESSTTSTVFQNKTILTFTPTNAGQHLITVTGLMHGNSQGDSVLANVELDGVNISDWQWEPKDADIANDYQSFGMHIVADLTAGPHTINLSWRSENGDQTFIKSSRISVIELRETWNGTNDAPVTLAVADTEVVRANITVDSEGTYLLIGTAEYTSGDLDITSMVNLSLNGIHFDGANYEPKDSSDIKAAFLHNTTNLTPGTYNLTLSASRGSGTGGFVRRARVSAIRLTPDFDPHFAFNDSVGSTTCAGACTSPFINQTILSFTPVQPGDYLFIATAQMTSGAGNDQTLVNLLIDGVPVCEVIQERRNNPVLDDQHTFVCQANASIGAGVHNASITFAAQGSDPTVEIRNARITAIRLTPDTQPPEVFDLIPRGDTFEAGTIINISANVTDDILVDQVLVNITFPNGTTITLPLVRNGGDRYNITFTNMETGFFNFTILANDSASNNRNDSEISNWTQTAVLVDQPIIAINKVASPNPVGNGSLLNYTITVTNSGPGAAINVNVTDIISPNVTFINASPQASNPENTSWFLGNIPGTESRTVNITVLLAPNITGPFNLGNTVNVSWENTTTNFTDQIEQNTSAVIVLPFEINDTFLTILCGQNVNVNDQTTCGIHARDHDGGPLNNGTIFWNVTNSTGGVIHAGDPEEPARFIVNGVYEINFTVPLAGNYLVHTWINQTMFAATQGVFFASPVNVSVDNLTVTVNNSEVLDAIQSSRDRLESLLNRQFDFSQEEVFLVTDAFNSMNKLLVAVENGDLSETEASVELARIEAELETKLANKKDQQITPKSSVFDRFTSPFSAVPKLLTGKSIKYFLYLMIILLVLANIGVAMHKRRKYDNLW